MASRDISLCHQYLQDRWPQLRDLFKKDHPFLELRLVCTFRPPYEQAALYQQGRTRPGPKVTNIDGVTRLSFHNYSPARAFDVGVFSKRKLEDGSVEEQYITDDKFYNFKKYAAELELEWGGNWKKFVDKPHFEVPKGIE